MGLKSRWSWVGAPRSFPGSVVLVLVVVDERSFCEAPLGLVEDDASVSDGEGNEVHLAPVLLEGHDEWGVVFGLLGEFVVACDVPTKSNLQHDEVPRLSLSTIHR